MRDSIVVLPLVFLSLAACAHRASRHETPRDDDGRDGRDGRDDAGGGGDDAVTHAPSLHAEAAAQEQGAGHPALDGAPRGDALTLARRPTLPLVAFLGDSLTAGYGLQPAEAWPSRIAELLAAEGRPIRMLEAGVSGDDTAQGLARLDAVLRERPDIVVVALGANDGLRGVPVDATERNLREILRRCRLSGARCLLAGMLVPPSQGAERFEAFRRVFHELSRTEDVPLVPFLLQDVALVPELNLDDGMHPNAEGHRRMAATVLPHLRSLL